MQSRKVAEVDQLHVEETEARDGHLMKTMIRARSPAAYSQEWRSGVLTWGLKSERRTCKNRTCWYLTFLSTKDNRYKCTTNSVQNQTKEGKRSGYVSWSFRISSRIGKRHRVGKNGCPSYIVLWMENVKYNLIEKRKLAVPQRAVEGRMNSISKLQHVYN